MNTPHVRAHIRLNTQDEITKFMVSLVDLEDSFSIEDFDGIQKANAKSTLGVMYASCDYGEQMYLVNLTNDGYFPAAIDRFRV